MADEKLIFDLLTGQNSIAKDLTSVNKQVTGIEKNISGITDSFSGVGSSVSKLTTGFTGLAAAAIAYVTGFVGNEIVKAAEEQENAINRLNAALRANGNEGTGASERLQQYAASLQKVSTIGDEVTLANLALLQSLAPLTEKGLIEANNAAANLAAGLRIDLESAVRLVGKAANGEVSAFKRYGIEIRQGKNDADTFANALTVLNSKFGGAAANEINTFAGAVAQSRNAFSDIVEEVGLAIIQTPKVIQIFKDSAATFANIAETIASHRGEIISAIGAIIDIASKAGRVFIDFALTVGVLKSVALAAEAASIGFAFINTNLDLLQARNGQGIFKSLITEIFGAIGAMKSLEIATVATRLAITTLRGVATLGLGIAIDLAIQKILELREKLGGLSNVFEFVALSFEKAFVDAIASVASSFAGFISEAANIPGGPDFLKGIASDAKAFADNMNGSAAAIQTQIDGIGKVAEQSQKNAEATNRAVASTKDLGKALLDLQKVNLEKLKDDTAQAIKGIKEALKNAGKSQTQIVAEEYVFRLKNISNAQRFSNITAQEGIDLRKKSELKLIADIKAAQTADDDARRKRLLESIQIAAQNPLNIALQKLPPIEIDPGSTTAIATGASALSFALKGAQGVSQLISSTVGALVDKVLPGLGGVASSILDAFSKGPEFIKSMISGFVQAIPEVIRNIVVAVSELGAIIVQAVPVFIQSLIDSLPDVLLAIFGQGAVDFIIAIADNVPVIIDKIVEGLPTILDRLLQGVGQAVISLVEHIPEIASAFATSMPQVALRLGIELARQAVPIAIAFGDALIKEAPRFITELIKSLPGAFGGALGIGGGGGGILGSIGGAIGGIFGFADGGTIQGGPPFADRLPAVLTPGETIVDRGLTQQLEKFLNGQGNQSASQQVTVIMQVGETELAKSIFELNRRGFRTA